MSARSLERSPKIWKPTLLAAGPVHGATRGCGGAGAGAAAAPNSCGSSWAGCCARALGDVVATTGVSVGVATAAGGATGSGDTSSSSVVVHHVGLLHAKKQLAVAKTGADSLWAAQACGSGALPVLEVVGIEYDGIWATAERIG